MSQHPLKRPQATERKIGPQARRKAVTSSALEVAELDALFERFAEYAFGALDHSPLTVRNYRYAYRIYRRFLVDPAIGTTNPSERIFELNAWLAWNRRRGISRFTLNMYWRSLRVFFNYLEREAGIVNPFRGVKSPGIPERTHKSVDPDVLRRILAAARRHSWSSRFVRERAVAILATLMYTGLRKSELLGLRLDDEESVNIKARWIHVVGKGRHGGKERWVPIPDALLEIYRTYLPERERQGFGTDALFPSQWGTPLSEVQFRRMIATVRRASGIKFSAHVLRHSFITMFHIGAKAPIAVVQAAAGHARLDTTAGYLKVRNEDLAKYARGLRI